MTLNVTDRYVFFWDGWPSQWHPSRFEVGGLPYNCCEQFMMAEKARVFGDVEAEERILASDSPRDQKAMGRNVRGFEQGRWNSVCRGIVYTGNLAKFSQNEGLRRKLMETGERVIVEASPYDVIWGIGLGMEDPRVHDPSQWRGSNWLGVDIMRVRATLARRSRGTADELDDELTGQLLCRERMRQEGGR